MDALSVPEQRGRGWYLSLMAPNTKGGNFSWLDPSRLYCNHQALSDCVQDLLQPFQNESIDLVAGIDAMGFILGTAIAASLSRGFLAIRKAGHLCIPTEGQKYVDYSGREKCMEVRKDVLRPAPKADGVLLSFVRSGGRAGSGQAGVSKNFDIELRGLRVLLVDQWIETGGTMRAAISLVEKFGATVVGVAAIAIERTTGGLWVRENYKCSHCIPEDLQAQIDQQYLDSFKSFTKLHLKQGHLRKPAEWLGTDAHPKREESV